MKKYIAALYLASFFFFSADAIASVESVVSGSSNGDKFTFVAKDTLGPGAPFGVTFAELVTGADPMFNILPNASFDGVLFTTVFGGFSTTGALASLDARVDTLEGSGFSGDYNDLTNRPSLFSGAYPDLTGKPTIPATFDQLTDGSTNKAFTSTLLAKLNGIVSGATQNDTDANLRARAGHTGTQAISTVLGLQSALDEKQSSISAGSSISDAATNAIFDASASSVTILGISVPTQASYAAIVVAHNDLATKYNDLSTKFNTLVAHMEAQGLQTP